MEHQVQQPPALLFAKQGGKTSVVYPAAKASRAHGCSESGASERPSRAVYQTQNGIEPR